MQVTHQAHFALSATPLATQRVTAPNWSRGQPIRSPPSPGQLTPGQTSIATCTTAEVPVFVAQSAPTAMSVPTAMEVTPSAPAPRPTDPIPISSHAPHTPLRPQVFARFLTSHPDSHFVSKLVHSLTDGFNIGYHGPRTPLTAPNLISALQHPAVVDEALKKEVAENRMAGPFNTPLTATFAVPALVLSRRRTEAGDSLTTSLPLQTTASTISLTPRNAPCSTRPLTTPSESAIRLAKGPSWQR